LGLTIATPRLVERRVRTHLNPRFFEHTPS
jgi:hypothetical protein